MDVEYAPGLIIVGLIVVLIGYGLLSSRGSRSGSRPRSAVCNHDWGMADAETGWDQKCRKCGEWRSGYGKTW